MDFIYEFYDSLMWIRESDGEREYKKPYMTLTEIDNMDIFFFLDLKIYDSRKEQKETVNKYDSMGL